MIVKHGCKTEPMARPLSPASPTPAPLEELAEEFRQTREGKEATSNPKHLAAADAFLIAKADGFRLSGNMTRPLIDAAKELDETTANKITFTPQK